MYSLTPIELYANDRRPYCEVTLKNSDGSLVDLTGATIRCTMCLVGATALKINRQTVPALFPHRTRSQTRANLNTDGRPEIPILLAHTTLSLR